MIYPEVSELSQFHLLVNGDQAFPRILQAVDAAKTSILIQMFVWRDDAIGNLVLLRLLAAANRGVSVTVIKDRYAAGLEKGEENKQSMFHKKGPFLDVAQAWMLDQGYPMNKPKGYVQNPNAVAREFLNHPLVTLRAEYDLKDHTKFFLFDDTVLIFGGINIEDKEHSKDYLGRKYHDYMMETDDGILIRKFVARFFGGELRSMEYPEFIVNHAPHFEVYPAFLAMIANAKERIIITMAYFGNRPLLNLIAKKANEGVKVDILTSRMANLQPDLNRRCLSRLYKKTHGNVTIRLSEDMIHAKLIITDDIATIGSANLNNKSFFVLGELNLVSNESELVETILKSRIPYEQAAHRVTDLSDLAFTPWRAAFEYLFS